MHAQGFARTQFALESDELIVLHAEAQHFARFEAIELGAQIRQRAQLREIREREFEFAEDALERIASADHHFDGRQAERSTRSLGADELLSSDRALVCAGEVREPLFATPPSHSEHADHHDLHASALQRRQHPVFRADFQRHRLHFPARNRRKLLAPKGRVNPS